MLEIPYIQYKELKRINNELACFNEVGGSASYK